MAKVPAGTTAGHAWISETIGFAARNRVALDFISMHDYGVKGIGFDEGGQQLQLITDPDVIIGGVRCVRAQIARSPMPKLPLHYGGRVPIKY